MSLDFVYLCCFLYVYNYSFRVFIVLLNQLGSFVVNEGNVNGLFVVDDKDDDKDVYDISLVVFVFCVDDDDCFSC